MSDVLSAEKVAEYAAWVAEDRHYLPVMDARDVIRSHEQLRAERDAAREALRRIADPLNHHHKPDYTAPERIAREALENSAPGVGATPTTAAERYDGADGPTSGASAEGNAAAPGAEAAARAGGCAADALRETQQLLTSVRSGLVELAQVRGDEADGGDEGYLIGGLHATVDDALAAIFEALAAYDLAVSGQTAEKEEA